MNDKKMDYYLDEISEHYFNMTDIYRCEIEVQSNFIIEKLIDKVKDKDVLDLGLGHGFIHKHLVKNAKSYEVIEGSKRLIDNYYEKQHLNLPDIKITHCFFEDYTTKNRYDLIMLCRVLGFVEDPVKVLTQYKGYLKDGGELIVTVPNAMSLNRRIGFEAGMLSDICELSDIHKERGHKRYYTIDSMKDDLHKSGLNINKTEGILLKPITSAQMKRLNFNEAIFGALIKIGYLYPELCNHLYFECKKNEEC
jgi:2-polyprenyl-3-methyl-5-hydroxy-6-metoxy-1,4-benzoquinol methylase